jgi:hypothetical protein
MRFDGMDTLEGRHLVFAYASVFLIQGGYLLWLVRNWLKLNSEERKATKPAG